MEGRPFTLLSPSVAASLLALSLDGGLRLLARALAPQLLLGAHGGGS